jgi:hypothetical protein
MVIMSVGGTLGCDRVVWVMFIVCLVVWLLDVADYVVWTVFKSVGVAAGCYRFLCLVV